MTIKKISLMGFGTIGVVFCFPTPYNRMMFHLIRTKEKMNELNQKGKKRIGTGNNL